MSWGRNPMSRRFVVRECSRCGEMVCHSKDGYPLATHRNSKKCADGFQKRLKASLAAVKNAALAGAFK